MHHHMYFNTYCVLDSL